MSAPTSIQHGAQNTLQAAIAALIRREIAAFLALSLIFAVPLSCQQHDMMSLLDLNMIHVGHTAFMPEHAHHSPSGADHASHLSQYGDAQSGNAQYGDAQPVSVVAATLAALAGVTPAATMIAVVLTTAPVSISVLSFPVQRQLQPLDRPPRNA